MWLGIFTTFVFRERPLTCPQHKSGKDPSPHPKDPSKILGHTSKNPLRSQATGIFDVWPRIFQGSLGTGARNQRNKHNAVRGRQGENKYVTNRTTVEIYHKYTTKQCKPAHVGNTTTP